MYEYKLGVSGCLLKNLFKIFLVDVKLKSFTPVYFSKALLVSSKRFQNESILRH